MTLKTILNPLKPFRILSLMMSYVLGLGLVQYVAQIRSTERALEGGLFLLSFLIALDYLCGLQRTLQFDLWKETSDIDLIRIRWAYRIVAAFFITFCTSMLVGWMVQGMLWTGITVLLVVIFVTGVFYYLAQIHDILQPYQVLFEVIIIVISPAVMAYFVQSTSVHRFLTMSVVVLTPLYLACRLLEALIKFDTGEALKKDVIGTKLGWDNVMILHNALILTAYALLASMTLLGLPWFLTWPVFLGLPIGLVEIWLMERVRRGDRPLWKVMRVATISTFLFTGYFLAFAFWSR